MHTRPSLKSWKRKRRKAKTRTASDPQDQKIVLYEYGRGVRLCIGPKRTLLLTEPFCGGAEVAGATAQAVRTGKEFLGVMTPDEFLEYYAAGGHL